MLERLPGIQFSLRSMLWLVVAVSICLVGYQYDAFWAAAMGFLFVGAGIVLNDCLPHSKTRISSTQLLLGAGTMTLSCVLMFAAAYAGWASRLSGVLDYVAFALILFAACYGLLIRAATPTGGFNNIALLGYFAWITGAFMLNHVLFETIIRRLR